VAAAFEDAAVEYNLGAFSIGSKHTNDFFMQALVHRLLEGLMKLAKRLLFFQQSRPQCRVVRSGGLCGICLGDARSHDHGRRQRRRSAESHFPNEGTTENIHHAFLLFGPYKSTMSNLPM
jgi:hypothetical protein